MLPKRHTRHVVVKKWKEGRGREVENKEQMSFLSSREKENWGSRKKVNRPPQE